MLLFPFNSVPPGIRNSIYECLGIPDSLKLLKVDQQTRAQILHRGAIPKKITQMQLQLFDDPGSFTTDQDLQDPRKMTFKLKLNVKLNRTLFQGFLPVFRMRAEEFEVAERFKSRILKFGLTEISKDSNEAEKLSDFFTKIPKNYNGIPLKNMSILTGNTENWQFEVSDQKRWFMRRTTRRKEAVYMVSLNEAHTTRVDRNSTFNDEL
ncbi:unnamed protein product, partial [Mesorhabditis belari]|uniref:F-box domain-containing protein n=1 Tax=Mesorhabditis belari TaxID=2138241 RepID=A0AAF3EL68_9BILA